MALSGNEYLAVEASAKQKTWEKTPMKQDDERAISATIMRYANTMDMRDWDRFLTCFWDNAEIDYGPYGSWNSPQKLAAYLKKGVVDKGLHHITNVEINGTSDKATTLAFVIVIVPGDDGRGSILSTGYYNDHFEKRDGEWRIARRKYNLVISPPS
jgi:3-phenylpropionate/cinnamic acid dioxygenase small subunit